MIVDHTGDVSRWGGDAGLCDAKCATNAAGATEGNDARLGPPPVSAECAVTRTAQVGLYVVMDEAAFNELFGVVEAPLRRTLVAWYGPTLGRDAAQHALAWAWAHRPHFRSLPVPHVFPSSAVASLSEQQRAAVLLVHGTATASEKPPTC